MKLYIGANEILCTNQNLCSNRISYDINKKDYADTRILAENKKIMVDILDNKIENWYDQVKEGYGVIGEGFAKINDFEQQGFENFVWRYSIVTIFSKEENNYYKDDFLFSDGHKYDTAFQHWSSLLIEDLTKISEAEYYDRKNNNDYTGDKITMSSADLANYIIVAKRID